MDLTETPIDPAPVSDDGADDSLAAHESTFGPPKVDADEASAPRERHRARSQQATSEDFQQIQTLTKELRSKEAELAKIRPESVSGSPRLLTLRRQIQAINAELGEAAPPPAEPARPAAVPVDRATVQSPAKPLWGAFEAEIGTKYATWGDAQDAYTDARDSWKDADAAAKRVQSQVAEQVTQQQQAFDADVRAYLSKTETYAKSHPDFQAVTKEIRERHMPSVLLAAIVKADNPGDLVYALAQQPDATDDLYIAAAALPPTDDSVALLRRRLAKLSPQAALTGSAVTRPALPPAPKPPNPVRTGPIHTGDDLPGDESSLADHEKAYGPKRRR